MVATRKGGIDGLSLTQLAELYGGRQTRWADGQPVRLVLRPANDGDTALLASFSPAVKAGLDTAMARDGMVVALTDQDSADAIERLPGALGTSSLALLSAEHRRARALAIDGVMPTVATVVNGRYPFVKTMLLVAKAPVPPAVSQFLAFVASDAGRRILAEHGHAPALPDKAPAASAPAAAAAAMAAR